MDLGLKFQIITADIDESPAKDEKPLAHVKRLSKEKALAVETKIKNVATDYFILTADTIVVKNGKILGKPKNAADAKRMLLYLNGTSHSVITSWCWLGMQDGKRVSSVSHEVTKVRFSKRSADFWQWYISTGEPMDKAGAYAAQGIGMSFIESVNGSYANVVGLPLASVFKNFKKTFRKDYECVLR